MIFASRSFVTCSVGDGPPGIRSITLESPNMTWSASTSSMRKGRRESRSVSRGKLIPLRPQTCGYLLRWMNQLIRKMRDGDARTCFDVQRICIADGALTRKTGVSHVRVGVRSLFRNTCESGCCRVMRGSIPSRKGLELAIPLIHTVHLNKCQQAFSEVEWHEEPWPTDQFSREDTPRRSRR